MKINIKIIILTAIVSLVIGITNVKIVFNDSNIIIPILLSLLGLCLTAYTFVLIPIQSITKENKEKNNRVRRLLKEYKDDMLFIFFTCIVLIVIDLMYKTNFPLISNPENIDFGLFQIHSIKTFFKLVLEDFACILCLISFYDIMQSIFILVNNSMIDRD